MEWKREPIRPWSGTFTVPSSGPLVWARRAVFRDEPQARVAGEWAPGQTALGWTRLGPTLALFPARNILCFFDLYLNLVSLSWQVLCPRVAKT